MWVAGNEPGIPNGTKIQLHCPVGRVGMKTWGVFAGADGGYMLDYPKPGQ